MIGSFRTPFNNSGNSSGGGVVWSQSYYDNIYANSYTRPSDWLTLPTVLSTDQKIVMLHAVYDHNANHCALQCASNYTVDWGDGVVENFGANVSAYHLYNYANHSGTECSRGYRQAIVTVTPQASFNLTKLDLNIKHNASGLLSYSTGWLDIRMAGSFISTLTLGNSGINVSNSKIELFDFLGTNQVTDLSQKFRNCHALVKILNLNTDSVTLMNSSFFNCYSLVTIPFFKVDLVTSLNSTFGNCYSLLTIPLLNTSSVNNTQGMFSFCFSLQTIPLINSILVTNCISMFNSCKSLITIPLLNMASVNNCNSMFYECSSLQNIPLINTANVTNMGAMFYLCSSLITVPLINTQEVTSMDSMFRGCYSLQELPLFNTVKVTAMDSMLYDCYSLTTIPLWNTLSVVSMNNMFRNASSLQTVPLLNTENVTSMGTMFASCASIQSFPLWNMASCTNIGAMFNACTSLQSLPALNANLFNSNSFNNTFPGCNSLSRISIINIKVSLAISNLKLSTEAIIEIFNNLATVSGQTITISGNFGVSGLTSADRLIATNKGWTIVG